MRCSSLYCFDICCSVAQCFNSRCSVTHESCIDAVWLISHEFGLKVYALHCVNVRCSVVHCGAVCCTVTHESCVVAAWPASNAFVLQNVALTMCCSVLYTQSIQHTQLWLLVHKTTHHTAPHCNTDACLIVNTATHCNTHTATLIVVTHDVDSPQ